MRWCNLSTVTNLAFPNCSQRQLGERRNTVPSRAAFRLMWTLLLWVTKLTRSCGSVGAKSTFALLGIWPTRQIQLPPMKRKSRASFVGTGWTTLFPKGGHSHLPGSMLCNRSKRQSCVQCLKKKRRCLTRLQGACAATLDTLFLVMQRHGKANSNLTQQNGLCLHVKLQAAKHPRSSCGINGCM